LSYFRRLLSTLKSLALCDEIITIRQERKVPSGHKATMITHTHTYGERGVLSLERHQPGFTLRYSSEAACLYFSGYHSLYYKHILTIVIRRVDVNS
jgi:hypothetical protein